ncbi:hypothetical protein K458DRAFT_85719 [Lentithecium fluviatile CBS 122367]|uniref:Secreted protein n=1 Tax=Lentithecium fluviatile CBS 122367 TaxID=1168545 RepID=A0A6G1IS32_9PLEO|nr:hypothetical protein K458DRAFT_85719 [Lentithecium fluviatile CBS 122367]
MDILFVNVFLCVMWEALVGEGESDACHTLKTRCHKIPCRLFASFQHRHQSESTIPFNPIPTRITRARTYLPCSPAFRSPFPGPRAFQGRTPAPSPTTPALIHALVHRPALNQFPRPFLLEVGYIVYQHLKFVLLE